MARTINKKNPDGYADPTAYQAMTQITEEELELEAKVKNLIHCIKFIIGETGFELLNRIEIRDTKTGRCFR